MHRIQEQSVEITKEDPQERVQQHTVEQIGDVPVLQTQEQIAEVVIVIPQEHLSWCSSSETLHKREYHTTWSKESHLLSPRQHTCPVFSWHDMSGRTKVLMDVPPGLGSTLSRIANVLEKPRGRSMTATFGLQGRPCRKRRRIRCSLRRRAKRRSQRGGQSHRGVSHGGGRHDQGVSVTTHAGSSCLDPGRTSLRRCRKINGTDEFWGGSQRQWKGRWSRDAWPSIESGGVKENDGGGLQPFFRILEKLGEKFPCVAKHRIWRLERERWRRLAAFLQDSRKIGREREILLPVVPCAQRARKSLCVFTLLLRVRVCRTSPLLFRHKTLCISCLFSC